MIEFRKIGIWWDFEIFIYGITLQNFVCFSFLLCLFIFFLSVFVFSFVVVVSVFVVVDVHDRLFTAS